MLDAKELKSHIRQLCKEKDLDEDVIKASIERAILSASKKNLSQYRDAVANLNMDTGELTVTVTKTVVENEAVPTRDQIRVKEARKILKDKKVKAGDDVIVPIDPTEFGRIAAQSARQIMMQQMRDAERFKTFNEFKDRVGQVVTGIVQRFERRDVIMNIGRAEGILPLSEQPMGAKYKFNDRLKVMITRVEQTPRGPMIELSRKTPQLLIELFKQEVPEIVDGTVQIVGIAREAGVRTKLAVKSTNSDVDPVGACVGMKGSRVQMVVRELENEKIDIVPWSSDARTFISNALNPAKIVGIDLNESEKSAVVTVAQGNLAIAIGRKGQNTKLAARLTGYRLEIKSENEEELAYEEIQRRYLEDFLSQLGGVSELSLQALLRSNMNSVEKISQADPERLKPFLVDDEELTQRVIQGAREYLDALRQMEDQRRREREEEEAKGGEEATAEGAATAGAEAPDEEVSKPEAAEAETPAEETPETES
jgi:transcription termination/antitermination protein NusA